jgi:hypothetical protein
VLAEKLTGYLVREIMFRGSGGGPLTPLAEQLNHDLTHLRGQRVRQSGATPGVLWRRGGRGTRTPARPVSRGCRGGLDERRDLLAPVVVGHPDDGHVRDCRVGVQELLDLPR